MIAVAMTKAAMTRVLTTGVAMTKVATTATVVPMTGVAITRVPMTAAALTKVAMVISASRSTVSAPISTAPPVTCTTCLAVKCAASTKCVRRSPNFNRNGSAAVTTGTKWTT